MQTLNLSLLEVGVLLAVAILLGIAIHFFIVSRRNLKYPVVEKEQARKKQEAVELKFTEDLQNREKELDDLKKRLEEANKLASHATKELEEARRHARLLENELEELQSQPVPVVDNGKPDYLEQLRITQQSLKEHQQTVNSLLAQLGSVAESEQRQHQVLKESEELRIEVNDLRYMLEEKERELDTVRQQQHIAREMNSVIDSAYTEFNNIQERMQRMESQLAASRMIKIEYEDIKESFTKQAQELETMKHRVGHLTTENQQLKQQLADTEDRLSDTEFQKQQLQKRVGYLEELSHDLQVMSDANKKLEGQLRRMGELESMLNVVSEERDALLRKTSL